MHKVDSSGATALNEWTNGNPALGIPRTRVEAKYMNANMYELVNVVLQANLALSEADNTQLVQAIAFAVPTVAALRGLPVPSVPNGSQVTVLVRGGAVDGDGGPAAGMYRWVYNSAAVDDAVTAIKPTSNPPLGRWLRSSFGFATNASQLGGLAAGSYAQLASPAFTGNPTAPTQATGDNSTRLATTALVSAKIAALVNSSPAALDTLNELAAALGNDPSFATTVMNALAVKAPLNSPALTGAPTAAAPGTSDNSARIITSAWLRSLFGVNVSHGSNGYRVFPDGSIEQWCYVVVGDIAFDHWGTVSWPIAFPNLCESAQAALWLTDTDSYAELDASVGVCNTSRFGTDFTVQEWSAEPQSLGVYFTAKGY